MHTLKHPSLARLIQSGFTLVEIMVGLAIGMLATLVILQVLSVYEAQKSTTTGTADAQTNGAIALYSITRDLQMAGYPLIPTSGSPLKCAAVTVLHPAISAIIPVEITNGTSDTIVVRYGASGMGGIPSEITAGPLGNAVTLDNNLGCIADDITLARDAAGTNCFISSASAVTGTQTVTLDDPTGAAVGGTLACMGTSWNEVTYRVNAGNLERRNSAVSPAFVPSVPGIVSIQAQYGISISATSNQVTQWVDATAPTWAVPTVDDRNRIKAVRIAVVARNAKKEAAVVTTALNSWTGTASSPAPAISLSGDDPDWGHYRYKVYETVIPLRNIIWSKGSL